MKKISTIFSFLLLSFSLFAADTKPKTTLTIVSADRSDIRVVVDGRRFEPNTNYMRIRNMQAGYHSVKIYRERNSGLFTIFGQRYDMVFNNSLMVRSQSEITISIDRFGRARVDEQRLNGRGYGNDRGGRGLEDRSFDNRSWSNDNDYEFDRGSNYGDYGAPDRNGHDRDGRWNQNGNNGNGGYGQGNGGYGQGNGGYGQGNGGYGQGNGGYGQGNGGYGQGNTGGYSNNDSRVMSDYDFDRVLSSISRERFENNMIKSAQTIIGSSYFTSAQVKQMLQLFSFEDNKLQLAKQAYDKTVDQKNYYIVSDVFSFSSSKDEMARYIRSH